MYKINSGRHGKYGVSEKIRRTADNIVFDSQAEMMRYLELKRLVKGKVIRNLILQPKFELVPKFEKKGKKYQAISYAADFSYFDIDKNMVVVEDVKGFQTQEFKLKHKLFEYTYPDLELTLK